jgi:hypothetical protein
MTDAASRAVEKIERDVENRSGLGNSWDSIPRHHQESILKEWAAIIRAEMAAAQTEDPTGTEVANG